MTIRKYYSLEEYRKDFPDMGTGYLELRLHGFIQRRIIDDKEIKEIKKETSDLIKAMDEANKKAGHSKLRFSTA